MTWKNTNTWKGWRSDSSGRNGATLGHQEKNPADLTKMIRTYFAGDLYRNLEARRSQIREFANERDS